MTLLRRYRYANGSSSWGEPLQPFGHPTAGASLSLWEKTGLPHHSKWRKSPEYNSFDF
ncbi:hypothetical protein [Nostoc sp.]|uniref:hypothetical protein n=1 Tax=Nostoc sp. TaxID=1180 RepID=UPI002FF9009D